MDGDNPFEIEDGQPDAAVIDGLREMILDVIQPEWSRLSADPKRVADIVARRLAPVVTGTYGADDIRGHPWSTR